VILAALLIGSMLMREGWWGLLVAPAMIVGYDLVHPLDIGVLFDMLIVATCIWSAVRMRRWQARLTPLRPVGDTPARRARRLIARVRQRETWVLVDDDARLVADVTGRAEVVVHFPGNGGYRASRAVFIPPQVPLPPYTVYSEVSWGRGVLLGTSTEGQFS
jgi:hypothetical protein